MLQSESVAQLMDGFLQQALLDKRRVGRKAVEFFAQAERGDDCARAGKLGLAEYVGENRHAQVQSGDPDEARTIRRGSFGQTSQ